MKPWKKVKTMLKVRFGQALGYVQNWYIGIESPLMHTELRVTKRIENEILEEEWVHQFIHTLDIVPSNWYTQQEWRHSTTTQP